MDEWNIISSQKQILYASDWALIYYMYILCLSLFFVPEKRRNAKFSAEKETPNHLPGLPGTVLFLLVHRLLKNSKISCCQADTKILI